jgi:uncharacterized Zn-binding protein involved in type VI secretion
MTAHGTPLSGAGSANVLIGGLPAWRAGADFHACPLSAGPVPHTGGVVVTGCPTVLINGYPAARLGDTIVENGPPNTVASGAPTVIIGSGGAPTSTSDSDSAGATAPVDPPWVADLYEQLTSYIDRYNGAVAGADIGAAQRQLASERVNLRVAGDEGAAAFSFTTDGQTRIGSFERGHRDDATIHMETDRETVAEITAADRPAEAFRAALVEDDISIRGTGAADRIRWAIIDLAEEIAELLGIA